MFRRFLPTLTLFLTACTAFAQCPPGLMLVTVDVRTDNFGYETTWQLSDVGTGVVASGGSLPQYADTTFYTQSVCVPSDACLRFEINDEFGDGICCDYGEGYYRISINGEEVAFGGDFGLYAQELFNCPPGYSCATSIEVTEGSYTAPATDTWYSFVPEENGTYGISTCTNNCDTRIWVYDYCQGLLAAQDNTATIYYDDEQGGCAPQAALNAMLLEAGVKYWIRIGSDHGACEGEIDWSLTYNGPIVGCMDPEACDYNPLATVQEGECIYDGDPDCPNGPDLVLNGDELANSMYLSTLTTNSNDCRIDEGCLNGYGLRQVLRFTTHIYNSGNADYYVGNPSQNPDQFNSNNCHNHNHYEGYAAYRLFDMGGEEIPIGFKNGFCIMDLECWSGGGTAQYGCSNMGISKQCGDIYESNLDCQFIDITDVDTGLYTFVNTVNWDQSPDALGRYETSYANNWAQVCIYIGKNSQGVMYVEQQDDCDSYVDCAGEIFGNTQPDCMGDCGGTTLRGDLNADSQQNTIDAQQYVASILADDISAQPCNDLNADGEIDVYDATLLSDCWLTVDLHPTGSNHDHCNFPYGITNIYDTVHLSIGAMDHGAQTIDIHIRNPDSRIVAYQFEMSGVQIANVTNLVSADEYPIAPSSTIGGSTVIGISYQDSLIERSNTPHPLCRIHYVALQGEEVCIANIQSIVNGKYEEVITSIEGDCVPSLVNVDELSDGGVSIAAYPNPFSEQVTLHIANRFSTSVWATLTDIAGKQVRDLGRITADRTVIPRGNLTPGLYFVHVTDGRRVLARQRILVQ